MGAPLPILELITIPSPCSNKWEEMTGDDRVRHCGECGKNVYDLSALTRKQAAALIAEKEGKLCGRLYRRPDGTLSTGECRPPAPPDAPVKDDTLMVMGEIASPPPMALQPETALARDLVLAELSRSLRAEAPADAERMLVLLEASLPGDGEPCACGACGEPLRLVEAEPPAPADPAADEDGLWRRAVTALAATHGERAVALERELRRRAIVKAGWMSCPHCHDPAALPDAGPSETTEA